jgi:hypothetical protein
MCRGRFSSLGFASVVCGVNDDDDDDIDDDDDDDGDGLSWYPRESTFLSLCINRTPHLSYWRGVAYVHL